MHQFTAAHRTLPFNCVVRVTNLDNGKQTEVRINV
jgi:rare lipoprotein A